MSNNQIFLKAYLKYNLGDDLFLDIISKRYCNEKFITTSKLSYKGSFNENVKVISSKFYWLLNKMLKVVTNKKYSLLNHTASKSKLPILIGGSMFIQNNNKSQEKLLKKYNFSYILGSNFGPYLTEEYLEYCKEIFARAQDVCFRDRYSYNLFKDLPNVRCASDIVFSLDTSNIKITNNKKVVISVIDCNRKTKAEYKEVYENKIIEMIKNFDEKGYKIVLMSYCKAEGDEEAIKSILNKIKDNELKNRIETYFYDGKIDEALNVMGDCQIVVGSRFHANILGLVFNKTIIPIAYSDKTINVLKDINFKGEILDVRNLEQFNPDFLTEENLNYKLDISFQRKDAELHFKELDKVLNRKAKNE